MSKRYYQRMVIVWGVWAILQLALFAVYSAQQRPVWATLAAVTLLGDLWLIRFNWRKAKESK